jgi:hypothetical protein
LHAFFRMRRASVPPPVTTDVFQLFRKGHNPGMSRSDLKVHKTFSRTSASFLPTPANPVIQSP